MTTPVVKLKRSAVSGKVPLPADLAFGEIAINYFDGVIYYKKPDNTIGVLSGGGGGGGSGGTVLRSTFETTVSEVTQSTFTLPSGYTPVYLDVILNGVVLNAADYTATDGSTVTLNEAAFAGDTLRFIAYNSAEILNVYTKAETDYLIEQIATDKAIVMAIALG
jgi:hypothetical protein